MLLGGKKMDEDLISLIEQILGKDEKHIPFRLKDFLPTIIFTFIPFVIEIVSVFFIKMKQLEIFFMIAFIISSATQVIYVITGFICISKDFYKSQKVSVHSILQDFNNYKKIKFEIENIIEKLNTRDSELLFTFKEYLLLEKSKFDNRCSFLFEGVQNVGLFSLIYLFVKNIEEISKLSTPLSTISIFTFVFPLVVSLFILFEKKKAYKLNQILIYLDEIK